jgi:hypothetical protein
MYDHLQGARDQYFVKSPNLSVLNINVNYCFKVYICAWVGIKQQWQQAALPPVVGDETLVLKTVCFRAVETCVCSTVMQAVFAG